MSKRSAASLIISAVLVFIPARLLSGPPRSGQVARQSTQTDRFVAKLLQNRYALSVRSGQLSGAGAQVLRSAIAQSRFVLLGEDHGVAQTPEFWAAVCTAAGREQFHTMAVEEGPLVAAELEGWARRPDGLAQLVAFEKDSPNPSMCTTRAKNSSCCSSALVSVRLRFACGV